MLKNFLFRDECAIYTNIFSEPKSLPKCTEKETLEYLNYFAWIGLGTIGASAFIIYFNYIYFAITGSESEKFFEKTSRMRISDENFQPTNYFKYLYNFDHHKFFKILFHNINLESELYKTYKNVLSIYYGIVPEIFTKPFFKAFVRPVIFLIPIAVDAADIVFDFLYIKDTNKVDYETFLHTSKIALNFMVAFGFIGIVKFYIYSFIYIWYNEDDTDANSKDQAGMKNFLRIVHITFSFVFEGQVLEIIKLFQFFGAILWFQY